jgi:L-2-hydroxyglutarate oxidase LhgO
MTDKTCDFLVIGAGVIGLAIAREIMINNELTKNIMMLEC